MAWAWMLLSAHALGTRTKLWFGHGCSGRRMLLEHEMNWSAYALGTRAELWFGHGCSGAPENLNQNSSRPRTHVPHPGLMGRLKI